MVVWLRTVVNYWTIIAARWITSISLSRSYSFELVLRDGRQTRPELCTKGWLCYGARRAGLLGLGETEAQRLLLLLPLLPIPYCRCCCCCCLP